MAIELGKRIVDGSIQDLDIPNFFNDMWNIISINEKRKW